MALSAPPPQRQSRRPISGPRIEMVLSRSVAIFGFAFGLQCLPVALAQRPQLHDWWLLLLGGTFIAALLFSATASIIGRWVRPANISVLSVFLLILATWPFGLTDGVWTEEGRPWPWFVITVATAAAAIALRPWAATAYLLIAPMIYGVIRTSTYGGGVPLNQAFMDVAYATILGGAVLIIATRFRAAAAAVDAAQATALARYSTAVREHAMEVERVQVDAIVHDSVLTTLLSAARAESPEERRLAARMARNAIGHLERSAARDESEVPARELAERIIEAAATVGGTVRVPDHLRLEGTLPTTAAESVYSAATQALVNSVQHAGDDPGIDRWVAIRVPPRGGIEVEVGDTGRGFVLEHVPQERLGLRVSILERVAGVGGHAEVQSGHGAGTVVTIRWPAEPSLSRTGASADGADADGTIGEAGADR